MKAASSKSPWKRYLPGEDAHKAAELEKKLAQLMEGGQISEALKLARMMVDLRSNRQGANHWQAVNAPTPRQRPGRSRTIHPS
jgi:hypothetical protein